MIDPAACPHPHRRLIAQDNDAEFVECLDCGAILEACDLADPASFHETLSDA